MINNAKSLIFRLFSELRASGYSQFDVAIPEEGFEYMNWGDLDLEGKRLLHNTVNLLAFIMTKETPEFKITFTKGDKGTLMFSYDPNLEDKDVNN